MAQSSRRPFATTRWSRRSTRTLSSIRSCRTLPVAGRLAERKSAVFSEKYADYLQLGVEEWRNSYAENRKLGKKAMLFVMVDDTRNCDEVGAYLEKTAPDLAGAVLVIHTKKNGEISEAASSKKNEELVILRKASNDIDTWQSPYKAIVSVLMLKEGWDVRNVTTIVGLRAYTSKSNILPEQTLGRGLRRMYFGSDIPETVSVMGTPAFMEFVESIQSEGVQLEYRPMGGGAQRKDSIVVEVDAENASKDIAALDIEIPKLARRYNRDYKNLDAIQPSQFGNPKLPLKSFSPEQTREIVFKTMLEDAAHHTIHLDGAGPADWRSVVGFFARQLLKDMRLVGGYDALYPKVRDFIRDNLFEKSPVNLEDAVVLRNLSEPEPGKVLFDSFRKAINALTVSDTGTARIEDTIRLRNTRPFRTMDRPYLPAKKSVFNKMVAEPNAGGFELAFAKFLDDAPDVTSFAKNYLAVGFKIDYVKADGDLSNYVPDFIVKTADGNIWIVETKGRIELDLPQKMARLAQWCADATQASKDNRGPVYSFVFVDEAGFNAHKPPTFAGLVATFRDYQS